MEIDKKCTSNSTNEGEPYLTANNQISVPFTADELVKTVEIVFNAGTLFAHAQITEIFIHIKKLVPGKRLH